MQDMFTEFESESAVEADEITLSQLDEYIKKLVSLRAEYDEAKKRSSEINTLVEEQESFVLGILNKLNRNSYDAEGVAKVTKCMATTYKVPKELSSKKELFDYIKGKHGPDTLMNMVSINHQTLNSWAKQELQTVSTIPGLELPTSMEYIQVRRSK